MIQYVGCGEAAMISDGEELLRLWEGSENFEKVALRAYGQDTPLRAEGESISDEELDAFKALRDALIDGRFIGIGFAAPKRLGDHPIQIPKEAWVPDPSALRLGFPDVFGGLPHGADYICDVRVLATAKHLTKTDGRPTFERIFTLAIKQMAKDGEIDVGRKQTSHFPAVRQRAVQMFPLHKAEIDGASTRTIAKYFSPIFNSL